MNIEGMKNYLLAVAADSSYAYFGGSDRPALDKASIIDLAEHCRSMSYNDQWATQARKERFYAYSKALYRLASLPGMKWL